MVTKKLYIDLYQHTIETKTLNHFTYVLEFYDAIRFQKVVHSQQGTNDLVPRLVEGKNWSGTLTQNWQTNIVFMFRPSAGQGRDTHEPSYIPGVGCKPKCIEAEDDIVAQLHEQVNHPPKHIPRKSCIKKAVIR